MELTQPLSQLSTQALGRLGEQVAVDYLLAHDYTILERNWRCRRGELDIVACKGNAVVAIEVKTRRGTRYGAPLESIGYIKARRLRSLLALWVRERKPGRTRLRIDAIGITYGEGARPRIEHIEGIL